MKKAFLIAASMFALIAGEVAFAGGAVQIEEATVNALKNSPTAREAMQKYLNLSGEALNAENVVGQISKYGAGPQVQAAIAAFAAKTASGVSAEDAARAVFTQNGKIVEATQLTANVDARSSRVSGFLSNVAKTSVPQVAPPSGETCSVQAFEAGYGEGLDASEAAQFNRDQAIALQESGKRPVPVGDCAGGVVKYGVVAKRNLAKIVHMLVQAHNYSRSMWKKAYSAVMGASDATAEQAVGDFENVCHIAQPVGA